MNAKSTEIKALLRLIYDDIGREPRAAAEYVRRRDIYLDELNVALREERTPAPRGDA